jgi:hypothetical protein
LKEVTVKLKIFADKNICEIIFAIRKYPCSLCQIKKQQKGDFTTAKIFTANIFIRNFFFFFIWAMTVVFKLKNTPDFKGINANSLTDSS